MPNLNVEAKEETMKAVRIQAAVQGVSQREWVERTIESAVNDEAGLTAADRVGTVNLAAKAGQTPNLDLFRN